MTYKERLQIEHPKKVRGAFNGGCFECPHTYGYQKKEDCIKNCRCNGGKGCEYCWNREIPVDEFHVGDKVRLRKGLDTRKCYDGIQLFKTMVFEGEKRVRGFSESGNVLVGSYNYSPIMLEKVEERKEDMKKEFTKSDLKDGNMCKTRNGEIYMWLNGNLVCESKIGGLTQTENNLNNGISDKWDIVQVRNSEGYGSIDLIFSNFEKLPIIWERKQATKDVSLEEINALLKEKYPYIDKFNLPIKE